MGCPDVGAQTKAFSLAVDLSTLPPRASNAPVGLEASCMRAGAIATCRGLASRGRSPFLPAQECRDIECGVDILFGRSRRGVREHEVWKQQGRANRRRYLDHWPPPGQEPTQGKPLPARGWRHRRV